MSDGTISLNGAASILFVGNSFTFGRVDPVMSYNAANVRDLTAPVPGTTFANLIGTNSYEPHPWGGVPGIFKQFTVDSGLTYDVALSTRNAASLQGHYLNSNPGGWDLRGNVASQAWDTVVLQDNSTQALPSGTGTITFKAGSSIAELVLTPVGDAKVEADETVGITLAGGSTYRVGTTGTLIGTILNDDPTGPAVNPNLATVTLAADPSAAVEDGGGKLVYTFTRTGSTDQALNITFDVRRDGSTAPSVATTTAGDFQNQALGDGTSSIYKFESGGAKTAGSVSFTSNTGSVTIAKGATTATLTLVPKADTGVESDESIRITLSAPSANPAYNVGTQGPVAVTIVNDDFAAGTNTSLPNITVNLPKTSVYEDGTEKLAWQFNRTGSLDKDLTVSFSVDGTATRSLTAAGDTAQSVDDFTVDGAATFKTGGAANPDLASFQTYAVKLAQYATTGNADQVGATAVPANAHANPAADIFLYETWARPNLVAGARIATSDDTTGAITTSGTSAAEYYTNLEAMTADLRAAYEGLAASNPIFKGVAPVGAAFLAAVQNGTAIRDPYGTTPGATLGNVDLWWDDNLHASKYGSYLSALTLYGTITGVDPRSLGSAEKAAADLGIDPAVATALQAIAAATLGFSLKASWTAPGQVTEQPGVGSGLLASAGAFTFSDSDAADLHTVGVTASAGTLGSLAATLHKDTAGDGTGGAVNWVYTVKDADIAYLGSGETRIERFVVTVSDQNGGSAQREIAVTINGADDITSPSAGVFYGTPGNDTIIGDDSVTNIFYGRGGIDTFIGHGGNDFYVLNSAADTIVEQAAEGTLDTAYVSFDSYTLAANVEQLVMTGTSDLTGYGNAGDNVLSGNSGSNTLYGGGGVDIFIGGAGNDIYVLNGISDIIVEQVDGGSDTASVDFNYYTLAANVEQLVMTGTANLAAYGNEGDNTFYGNAGDNTFIGGGGVDTFVGGAGNDYYVLNSAADTIIENAGEGRDTAYAGFSYTLTDNVEQLVLTGTDDFAATGNTSNNALYGNSGGNTLNGAAGNDYLVGGGGSDVFVFLGDFGQDVVVDFTTGQDKAAVDHTQFADFTAIQAHAAQVGADTVITYDAANTIALQNVNVANLQAGDFLFV